MSQSQFRASYSLASVSRTGSIALIIGLISPLGNIGCNYDTQHPNNGSAPISDIDANLPSSPNDRLELLQQHYMQRLAASSLGTVSGSVLSLNDAPLNGVSVKIGKQTTTTDTSGRYILTEVPVGNYVITFEHAQYVLTQRPVTVLPNVDPQVDVNLLSRSKAQRLDADKGGSLTEGPLTLSFGPSALAFLDGSLVHGPIDVVMTVIDPRKPRHITAAPAILEGIDLNGSQVGLISYGMAEIEVFQGTKRVQVRSGHSVRAAMNIEGFDRPKDDTIPLWHHDTELGVWVQEPNVPNVDKYSFNGVSQIGTARVQRDAAGGLVAVAELPHFSSWNWDGLLGATCSHVMVPGGTMINGLRVMSTTSTGTIDNLWTVNGQCYGPSPLGTRCWTVSPSGPDGFGGNTFFKYQALVGSTWCDVTIALHRLGDPLPTTGGKLILTGHDINTWLMEIGETQAASWCSTTRPGNGPITGPWNIALPTPIPTPRVTLAVVDGLGSCSSLVGGTAASRAGDPGFKAMIDNALSTSASRSDADRDGINDAFDKCSSNSGPQIDNNNNGIGDTCEIGCFIPLSDPFSRFFDFDQDGIDDICDNRPSIFNPSQYVPTF